jgi:YbbR domain-containing protein
VAWIIRFLTDNWVLKLVALGLAILLWLSVTANEPERAAFRGIPVNVDLRAPDWRLDKLEPRTVTVTVQGPRGELMGLSSDPPRIVLPVENVNDTLESQVVPLQWVQLPTDLRDTRVVALRPDTIRMYFQRLESRMLPVQIRTRGDLDDSLALSLPVNTNPATVQVRGPAGALATLDSVPLMPVDLSGLTTTTNVPTTVDTTALPGFRFDPQEVNVVLRVVPADSQPGAAPDSAQQSPR